MTDQVIVSQSKTHLIQKLPPYPYQGSYWSTHIWDDKSLPAEGEVKRYVEEYLRNPFQQLRARHRQMDESVTKSLETLGTPQDSQEQESVRGLTKAANTKDSNLFSEMEKELKRYSPAVASKFHTRIEDSLMKRDPINSRIAEVRTDIQTVQETLQAIPPLLELAADEVYKD